VDLANATKNEIQKVIDFIEKQLATKND